ncbi:uncharacterized protein Nmag_2285 [Natrialba magadii ATCC 43099]|uniref:Secreted glycoprotein n=1 Tax=Natrialba magadii (strain ATCC 43099 / DSM 3394 / CCM 3739 / CIP 104546 / IAM 13178 / JCM 8861 / NBRC 102185 / NCIMB 2190 / MS3) TaxID=547559 RepID=D3SWW7_NATMM|nr:PGF-pre-PGF domain-containing protein [Natrialba magadii]ADD05849.1 uncharacterized protein Nmag_2285 [Natrialba magadii ATCC 43099]ELY30643.1 hypothetical protein C500_08987 [Natrialba magadii ATCC 43099]
MRCLAAILLVAVGLVAVAGVAGAGQLPVDSSHHSSSVSPPDAETYVVEQGEFCQPIEPLESGETIEAFYDYRDHETHPETDDNLYSSYGTTHLQEDDTSVLFLHEGPNGVSLVMIHGQLDGNGDPTYATFDLAGLPDDSEWVVRNDAYDDVTNLDEFHRGDGWASATWLQRGDRTGGGAIQGGLDDEFAVTVHPAFNHEATVNHENHDHPDPDFYTPGTVDAWDVLSSDADNPERTALPSLEEPVTIRTGTCADASITYDRTATGIAADVTDADPADTVTLHPTTGTADAIRFDQITVSDIDGDVSLTFANAPPDMDPSSPVDADPLSQLTLRDDPVQGAQATVTFSVDRAYLEAQGLEPESIALFEVADGEWEQSETRVSDETATAYQFTAEIDTLQAVTVAESDDDPNATPNDENGTGPSDTGTDDVGNNATSTDTANGENNATGSETDGSGDESSPLPGFGAGVTVTVIAVVLLTALWAGSRQ